MLSALGTEVKLSRIARIIRLDVINRFIHYPQGHFGRHGFAILVAGGDGESPGVPRLVFVAIGFHIDLEKILEGRNDHLFCIQEDLRVADHRGTQEDIGDMLFLNGQLEEFHGARKVDELVTVEVLAFKAEEHVAIVGGHT